MPLVGKEGMDVVVLSGKEIFYAQYVGLCFDLTLVFVCRRHSMIGVQCCSLLEVFFAHIAIW